jgi:hypothetical protein
VAKRWAYASALETCPTGMMEELALVATRIESRLASLVGRNARDAAKMWIALYELVNKYPGGDVSMVRPDGTVLTFDGGKSIIGPWGITIDGNDNLWVANAMGRSVTCPASTISLA